MDGRERKAAAGPQPAGHVGDDAGVERRVLGEHADRVHEIERGRAELVRASGRPARASIVAAAIRCGVDRVTGLVEHRRRGVEADQRRTLASAQK